MARRCLHRFTIRSEREVGGDPHLAVSEYDRKFRPFIERKHRSAERIAVRFAPKTLFGIHVPNVTTPLKSSPQLAKGLMSRKISDQLALLDLGLGHAVAVN